MEDIGAALGEKEGQITHGHTVWKQQSRECLGHTVWRLFIHLGMCSRKAACMERPPLGTKKLVGNISLHPIFLHPRINKGPPVETGAVLTLIT